MVLVFCCDYSVIADDCGIIDYSSTCSISSENLL
nr:MAG TPA: hypothetical protein [Caudoviricetes sp.]